MPLYGVMNKISHKKIVNQGALTIIIFWRFFHREHKNLKKNWANCLPVSIFCIFSYFLVFPCRFKVVFRILTIFNMNWLAWIPKLGLGSSWQYMALIIQRPGVKPGVTASFQMVVRFFIKLVQYTTYNKLINMSQIGTLKNSKWLKERLL